MIDRKIFFDNIRESLFHVITHEQVDGTSALFDEWEKERSADDTRWLAYVLATAYHETAHTMQPIEEYGHGKGRPYGVPDERGIAFYGRGYCQLTWDKNYKRAGNYCNADLFNHPEKALEPAIAAKIICQGMKEGWFTGKKLGDYFNADRDDPVGARHIINGSDRAELIASYYRCFANALTAAKKPDAKAPYLHPEDDTPPSHPWWKFWA